MPTLVIQHTEGSKPPEFTVIRQVPLQTTPNAACITAPELFEVPQLANTNLRRELRWYLEQFLDYPFEPNLEKADHLLDGLKAWGTHAFEALFGTGRGRAFYRDAVRDDPGQLQLIVAGHNPLILAWPWESLYDPERSYLAHQCHIERQLNNVADPLSLPEDLPNDRINILLVSARPSEADVRYRSISRSLVELIHKDHLHAEVTVLRPPTFDRLREALRERPGYYHILHFDGHGGYGVIAADPAQASTLADAVDPHQYQGPQGCLVFETAEGRPQPIPAETLSATLREHRIPMVVLNACQSANLDGNAEDAFACVAASLIRAGSRSVVAMAYSLYVSGAQVFLPAFYGRLLETGDLADSTRAGRQAMLTHPGRVCARGTYPLKDWLVPVVYQQQPMDFSFVAQDISADRPQQTTSLPEEALDQENPYGFIGRDGATLTLERAMHRDAPAVLIHGLGGVGKTTLARGFVQWLQQTGGLGHGCFWFTFSDIHAAESVLNRMGQALFGTEFITVDTKKKLMALSQALREDQFIIIWDNFESASGNEAAGIDPLLSAEDLQLLRRFLQVLRGGKSKVLITSRSEEAWLPADQRYRLSLGGLVGEERWEFCTALLRNLGIQVNRQDPDLAKLMDLLDGHPLLMRAILPRLEGASAGSILEQVRGNIAQLSPDADETQKKVNAILGFVEQGLPEDLREVLLPLALHKRFANVPELEAMAKQIKDSGITRSRIDRLMAALATAGLVRDRGNGVIYELHPALSGFLSVTVLQQTESAQLELWKRAFIDVLASLADNLAPRPLHEQRAYFHIHSVNFHTALNHAEDLGMDTAFGVLVQSLGGYAENTHDYVSAKRMYEQFAKNRSGLGDEKGLAAAYQHLGMIAEKRHDYDTAEKWCLKSLEISEKLDDQAGAADTYHNLGIIAEERHDYDTAEKWYLTSLEISENLGTEGNAARTYHQLGIIAEERHDYDTAEKWCLKSLEIEEKLGVISYTASTYHQLGRIAQHRHDYDTAEKWYLKSLEIEEKLGNEAGAAITYHQLGIIAQERHDYDTAEKWYLKALEIEEKLGRHVVAAITSCQLGLLVGLLKRFVEAGQWLIKSILVFQRYGDQHGVTRNMRTFRLVLELASGSEKKDMLKMWQEAGLGPTSEELALVSPAVSASFSEQPFNGLLGSVTGCP